MHNLMTRAPDIKSPRKPPLRDPDSVDGRTREIEYSELHEVADSLPLVLEFPAMIEDAVRDGDEIGCPE